MEHFRHIAAADTCPPRFQEAEETPANLALALPSTFASTGRVLLELGLVGSHSGNMSIRSGDRMVITRHEAMLGSLKPSDLVAVPLTPTLSPKGRGRKSVASAVGVGQTRAEPSMDLEIHRAIYAATKAKAIVHAHPVHAVALSLSRKRIAPMDVEGIYHLKSVPVVGTNTIESYRDMARLLPPVLSRSRVALMCGHGSYSIGASLEEALHLTSALEFSAAVLAISRG